MKYHLCSVTIIVVYFKKLWNKKSSLIYSFKPVHYTFAISEKNKRIDNTALVSFWKFAIRVNFKVKLD